MIKAIKYCWHWILYYLTFLFPRNKKLWVYGGGLDKFIDNEKYAFYYANIHYGQIRHVWLTKNPEVVTFLKTRGYNSVRSDSWRGVWYALRAGVYIYGTGINDFGYIFLSGGAMRVNLWHGIPLKKIMYDVKTGPMAMPAKNTLKGFLSRHYAPSTVVLSTSELLNPIFSSAFNVRIEQIVVGGYYRTLPFFMNQTEYGECMKKIGTDEINRLIQMLRQEKRKVVIYMPTFRDSNPNYLYEAIPDFKQLNSFCSENNILFLLKIHRYTLLNIDLSEYQSILNLNNDMDVYPLLPLTDILVTDYSSIMFDYGLLKKPVIYYAYDLEAYKSKSRELYFDYEKVIGSDVVTSFQSFLEKMNDSNLTYEPLKLNYFDAPTIFSKLFLSLFLKLKIHE